MINPITRILQISRNIFHRRLICIPIKARLSLKGCSIRQVARRNQARLRSSIPYEPIPGEVVPIVDDIVFEGEGLFVGKGEEVCVARVGGPVLDPVPEVVTALDGFGTGSECRVSVVPSDDSRFIYCAIERIY